ncbi:MAG: hypothetical protein C0501_04775 [Isosphaera sp.]|nr:hypothetical protein [Isosphaera sp.]
MTEVTVLALALLTGGLWDGGRVAPLPLADPAGRGYWVLGPSFRIPCNPDQLGPDVTHVELWYSADRGETWARSGVYPREERLFLFTAPRPGEYWFAPRLRHKDGSATPTDGDRLVTQLAVVVAVGERPAAPAARTDVLEAELLDIELALMARELKRLAAAPEFTPAVADRIDLLRARLRRLRHEPSDRQAPPDVRPENVLPEPPLPRVR